MQNISIEEHIKNQNDSLKWDFKMLNSDILFYEQENILPLRVGPFPVAKYDYFKKESFKGIGSMTFIENIGSKKIIFTSFYINKNNIDNNYPDNFQDKVYFTIGILVDYLDEDLIKQISNLVISRNHPDYLCEGTVKTKNMIFDYVGLHTLEGESFAIVNMKLFNLKYGNVILIAPQKRGYFKFLQTDFSSITDSIDVKNKIKEILINKKISEFFLSKNNI